MPSNWANTPEREKAWKSAKKIFKDQTKKKEKNWGDSEWAQVMTIAKNIMKSKKEKGMKKEIIEIQEEVQIGDSILEVGDKIKIIKEDVSGFWVDLWGDLKKDFGSKLVNVSFSTIDSTLDYGSPEDPASFTFTQFSDKILMLKNKNGKSLRILPSSSSKVTVYNANVWGFKLQCASMVVYILV